MPKASHHDDAHLNSLRDLCEQAEKLSKAADDLCKRLSERMEATRASLKLAMPERRRKPRKQK